MSRCTYIYVVYIFINSYTNPLFSGLNQVMLICFVLLTFLLIIKLCSTYLNQFHLRTTLLCLICFISFLLTMPCFA